MARKTRKIEKPQFKEQEDLIQRSEVFIKEIELRGGFTKLYFSEHTYRIVKQQGINKDNFYKLFSRMPEGIGLYSNPVLLCAVLKDMVYPADVLFGMDVTPPSQVTLKLGPGVANEMQEIITNAFQQTTKKTYRQVGLKKRFTAAFTVLSIAKMLEQNNDYTLALQFLFYSYSSIDEKIYPHSRILDIELVDKACKLCMKTHNTNDSGKLLTLSYLLYEIHRIGNALISTADYAKKLTPLRKPLITGIQYRDNLSVSDWLHYLRNLSSKFENIFRKYSETKYIQSVSEKGFVIEADGYLPLSDTTINQCIQYAQTCLEKLLKLKITENADVFSGPDMIDILFNIYARFKPKIIPHFEVIFDNTLLDDFKHLYEHLENFYKNP